MKCPEVYAWLLISRTTQTPPREVRRHLRHCPRCQARRTRLLLLDEELDQLPRPTPNHTLKANFVAQIELAPLLHTPTRRTARRRYGKVLLPVAAVLLVGLGMFWLATGRDNRSTDNKENKDNSGNAVSNGKESREAEEKLVSRFVDHNVHLATAFGANEQTKLMNAMALDLHSEALRLARQGQPDDLPLLATLYESVVRRGLTGRVQQLPPIQRRELLPVLVAQLRDSETHVMEAAADRTQIVADFLEPMRTAAKETAQLLQDDELVDASVDPLPAFAGGAGSPRALLALLVTQNLLIAEENDPLRRAYYCNDLADQLALASLLASARGDNERAALLGKHLTHIVDRGVGANLARVRQESPQDPSLHALEDVIQRARRTVEALEKTLPANDAGGHSASLPASDPRYAQAKELEKSLKELEKALSDVTKEKKPQLAKKETKSKGISGKVLSVDVAKRELVVSVKAKEKGRQAEMTFQVAPDAKLKDGSGIVTIADLKPGMEIEAKLRDGTTIIESLSTD